MDWWRIQSGNNVLHYDECERYVLRFVGTDEYGYHAFRIIVDCDRVPGSDFTVLQHVRNSHYVVANRKRYASGDFSYAGSKRSRLQHRRSCRGKHRQPGVLDRDRIANV
jgi:hypothetical protein